MDEADDPYKILGVSKDASEQQIKTAYRKLALKHHPDKQKTEEDKKSSTVMFAKISNAYELLSDTNQRREFDQQQAQQQPWSKMPRRQSDHDFFHHARFHNPFEIFEQFFRHEFGNDDFHSNVHNVHHQNIHNMHNMHNMHNAHHAARRSPFDDPFFNGGGMFGGSLFGGDPFGGSMFGNDPFFGGGAARPNPSSVARRDSRGIHDAFGDPFGGAGSIFSQMNDMMNMHDQMRGGAGGLDNNSGHRVSYSSTSSSFGGTGRQSVSTSTTTRIINGKRQSVTEHVITKPDGTVERKVTTSGDEDFPSLEGNGNSNGQYLDYAPQQEEKKIKKRRSVLKRKKQG